MTRHRSDNDHPNLQLYKYDHHVHTLHVAIVRAMEQIRKQDPTIHLIRIRHEKRETFRLLNYLPSVDFQTSFLQK
jgi:hypothetical protein